jgi:hypothetical protein
MAPNCESIRVDISEEKFLKYFWWCWNKLKEKTDDDIPMPTYFRFLALLAFKIFSAEQVDVAVLEVGLGGKFDATNVVCSVLLGASVSFFVIEIQDKLELYENLVCPRLFASSFFSLRPSFHPIQKV